MENVKPLYVNFESCSKTPQELLTAVELLIFEMLSDLQINNEDANDDILEDFIYCEEKREFFVNWAKETKNINLNFFCMMFLMHSDLLYIQTQNLQYIY